MAGNESSMIEKPRLVRGFFLMQKSFLEPGPGSSRCEETTHFMHGRIPMVTFMLTGWISLV